MTYFHASTAAELDVNRNDICLAESEGEAAPYLWGAAGYMHTVDVAGLRIASESDIRDAMDRAGVSGYVYEGADDADVRAMLVADGYDAMEYEDLGPDNRYEHTTLRVIVGDRIRVVSTVAM